MISTNDPSACRVYWDGLKRFAADLKAPKVLLLSHNVRIDNQVDLERLLGLRPNSAPETIIEAAWARWNQQCADHLRGSFAFALVAPGDPRVHLVRDIFGLSALFYHIDEHSITIAGRSTDVRAAISGRPDQNEVMLADFVSGILLEREETFFETVQRVPPAQVLSVALHSLSRLTYWSMSDIPRNVEPQDPATEFRAIFERSTRRCTQTGKAALMLSGGLDSSAIAAAWRENTSPDAALSAYGLVYHKTTGWSDADHLAAVSNRLDLDLVEVPSDSHNPLEDMEFWLEATDGPYHGVGHSVSTRLLKLAREAGFDVVLNGHGGDEIVSYGFGRVNELAAARQWRAAWREAKGLAGLYRARRPVAFLRYLSHYEALRPALRFLGRRVAQGQAVDVDFLASEIRAKVGGERYQMRPAASKIEHDDRMLQEEVLGMALQPASLEVYSLCSQAVGVDTRMPFYDRELLEMSLALPSHWKLRDGFSRFILRAAMQDRLPESVLIRRDKFDFGDPFIAGLVANREQVLDLTMPSSSALSSIVNTDRLETARTELTRNGTSIPRVDAFFLWRVAMLRMWADVSSRPPVKTNVNTIGKGI